VFTSVWILDRKPHRRSPDSCPGWEDPTLVVSFVIAMQDNPTSRSPDNDDDLVLKKDREAKRVNVERSRLGQVRDEQDQALKPIGPHSVDLSEYPDPLLSRIIRQDEI
jgi:hypothetical protein